jgi:hypothetical protein
MRTSLKLTLAGVATLVLWVAAPADAQSDAPCRDPHLRLDQQATCDRVSGERVYRWWRRERERRQAEIDAYLEDNRDDFDSFRTAPLAIRQDPLNFVGIQMIIFRLLPELFPDIWGPPGERMAVMGYGLDPWDPESVMPLGTGYILSEDFDIPDLPGPVQVNYAAFTCMGCHSGAVTLRDGTLQRMVGGPNPTSNYFNAVNRTVNDPRYTADNFRAALDSKPLGFVYGDPAELEQEIFERRLFNAPGGAEFFLEELKLISNKSNERFEETLGAFTYDLPNAPPFAIIGMLDAFGFDAAAVVDPADFDDPAELAAALPPLPSPTDLPAAWQLDDRPRFEWGNEVGTLVYRNVAASLSLTANDPAAVNEANVAAAADLTQFLPPAPYPFDVDVRMAARGKRVYERACAGCHEAGNTIIQLPEETGTDPGRAEVFTDYTIPRLLADLRAGCTELPDCFAPDGSPWPDDAIFVDSGGYNPAPLAGVWAIAPYLHNGSVPTLYHLIYGDRPETFYRANTTYDERLVGFDWNAPTNERAFVYDTRLSGFANTGHLGPEFNGGIDWDRHPRKLWDLLEYLKTL